MRDSQNTYIDRLIEWMIYRGQKQPRNAIFNGRTDGQMDGCTDRPYDPTTLRPCEDASKKTGYTANLVACGWAGAVMKLTNQAVGQEQ